ncbi:MAG: hypothetical protein AAF662_02165 [Pseudomonadota bacterium]
MKPSYYLDTLWPNERRPALAIVQAVGPISKDPAATCGPGKPRDDQLGGSNSSQRSERHKSCESREKKADDDNA